MEVNDFMPFVELYVCARSRVRVALGLGGGVVVSVVSIEMFRKMKQLF